MMKLTDQQKSTLGLFLKSPDVGDGWRKCSEVIYEQLIMNMPEQLVERDDANQRARPTDQGKVLIEWVC